MGATSFLSRTDGNSYGMSHVSTRDMGCPQWTRDVEGRPGHEWLEEEEEEGEEESMDVYTVNSHLQSSISSCREGIQKQLATLGGYVSQADDIETLQEIKSLITAALNISKVNRCKATLPLPSNEPANKNIAVQRPFFSTKRKRKPANVRLPKPTTKEKEGICEILVSGGFGNKATPLQHSTFSK